MQRLEGLYIMKIAKKGRAVFCATDIPKGALIEICPIIVIPENEVDMIHETELHDYYFVWGDRDEQAAIALGYGSLYNHSYQPNAEYIFDPENESIDVRAIKDIPAGKEITFNYHGDPKCKDTLWFDKSGKRIKRMKVGDSR
ncbi:MAG: SET domain-containing protein-lysine N-methyltransferase [Saprospiraceae bacterium]|nr:SET domain-containing protein-lysine N-methyltransferase [Saprospiraceae bacterium]